MFLVLTHGTLSTRMPTVGHGIQTEVASTVKTPSTSIGGSGIGKGLGGGGGRGFDRGAGRGQSGRGQQNQG